MKSTLVWATETRRVAVPGNRLQPLWLGDLRIQRSPNIGGHQQGVVNMSTLTQLSDAELDAVTGGSNVAIVDQSAANIGLDILSFNPQVIVQKAKVVQVGG